MHRVGGFPVTIRCERHRFLADDARSLWTEWIRDARLAYAGGYGWADLERRVPITTATLFDIGSTSKQFAAASLALVAQEHRLSFDDEVRKHTPKLPDYGAPLTIDTMMRHTSGLRDHAGLLALVGHSLEEVTTDSRTKT